MVCRIREAQVSVTEEYTIIWGGGGSYHSSMMALDHHIHAVIYYQINIPILLHTQILDVLPPKVPS